MMMMMMMVVVVVVVDAVLSQGLGTQRDSEDPVEDPSGVRR